MTKELLEKGFKDIAAVFSEIDIPSCLYDPEEEIKMNTQDTDLSTLLEEIKAYGQYWREIGHSEERNGLVATPKTGNSRFEEIEKLIVLVAG